MSNIAGVVLLVRSAVYASAKYARQHAALMPAFVMSVASAVVASASRWAMLGCLLLVLTVALVSPAFAEAVPGTDAVYDFGIDFTTQIDAIIGRISVFILPLMFVALGLMAIGLFYAWTRRST